MTSHSDKLAVVVPVYNDAENLRWCLSALVRARGQRNLDIWVVDDGSSDASSDVARSFGVHCVRSDVNRGQSWARNDGVRRSQCEYVLFVDSDVVVQNDCFDRIDEFLSTENPTNVIGLQGIFSLSHPFDDWSSLTYNALQHIYTHRCRAGGRINGSCLLVRRADFERLGGFREDLSFMEDTELGRRIARAGLRVQRGSLHFVHRKRTTWRAFFQVHITGGRMLATLSRDLRSENPLDSAPETDHRFALWLATGVLFPLALIGLGTAIVYNAPVFAIVFAAMMCYFVNGCRCLWRVRRNPLFFIVGTLALVLSAWLILLGRVTSGLPVIDRDSTERKRALATSAERSERGARGFAGARTCPFQFDAPREQLTGR